MFSLSEETLSGEAAWRHLQSHALLSSLSLMAWESSPCLELSSLQNRRPTIPIVTAPSLAGVNSQDARCHVEGVLCPWLGMTEMSPKVHCDRRLGPERRSAEHSCGPLGVLVRCLESLSQFAVIALCLSSGCELDETLTAAAAHQEVTGASRARLHPEPVL